MEQLVLDRSRSRLVISAIESLAERWVIPRLTKYAAACPEFRFDLRIEPDPVDFARHNIDLRVAYNPSHYPERAIVPPAHDMVLPLSGPAYLERNPDVRDQGMAAVPGNDLLHTSWGPSFASLPTWHDWLIKAKMKPPLATNGYQASNSCVALDLASAADARPPCATRLVAAGRRYCKAMPGMPVPKLSGLAARPMP